MGNGREWPAGIICVSFMGVGASVIRCPTTYQNLITTAISLFRPLFDETVEELYIKTNDFGLEWSVEVLPEVWEMPEVQSFLRTVEFHARTRGEGPSQLDFSSADRTQATAPLSPSSTPPPPRDVPGRAIAHSTPANRKARAYRPADDESTSGGYRGHSEDEVEPPEPESLSRVKPRVSLQARGANNNPRPIRTVRAEPTNEEIVPMSSQDTDVTTDTKMHVVVRYEDESVTASVFARKTFGSLFKGACNHFKLDRTTVKLFQIVAFDGRDSISPIECNLAASLGEGNVTDDDIFTLLPYDGGD